MTTSHPQRKSPRLQGYDYGQSGAYFVTLCTHLREHLFGAIKEGEMTLSEYGKIAGSLWQGIPDHYPDVELDAFVVMPNHVHGIVVIVPLNDSPSRTGHALSLRKSPSLSNIVGSYKSAVSREIRSYQPDVTVWQSRFHDHIIRNESSLNHIRSYIIHNPQLWEKDTFYG